MIDSDDGENVNDVSGSNNKKTELEFVVMNNTVYLKVDSVNEFADYLIENAVMTKEISENEKLFFIMGLEYFKDSLKEETQKLMVELDLKAIGQSVIQTKNIELL